jgi:hypothetical protein
MGEWFTVDKIGIIGLLISFGSLIVALLTFLDKRNKRKK